MRKNRLRELLNTGKPTLGTRLQSSWPSTVEVIGHTGLFDYVEFYNAPSELVLPRLIEKEEKADFAILDGNHRFEYVLVDLFFLGHLLEPGSLIFLDDLQLPGIQKAISFFVKNLSTANRNKK